MDKELNMFRTMFTTQMGEVTKPRRDEREWKIERRLIRRGVQRLKLGEGQTSYRREFQKTIYKNRKTKLFY